MKKLISTILLVLVLVLLPWQVWLEKYAFGATYYMRADGTATNKSAASGPCGTQANCMSIATHNSDIYSAGDTIVLCDDGGIFRARLNPPSSGSNASTLITYEAASGDTPIISGAMIISSWSGAGDNVWTASVIGGEGDPSQVFFDGTKGTKADRLDDVDNTNEWFWDGAEDNLYVYSTSNPSTAFDDPGIEASIRACIAQYAKDYVLFKNLTLVKSIHFTIKTLSTHATRLDGCTITNSGNSGLRIYGDGGYIKNCTFSHIKNSGIDGDSCSNYVIENNLIHDVFGNDAITLHDGTGADNIIQNNTMYNLGEEGVDVLNGFTGTITQDNLIYNCSECGIKYQSGVPGIIRRNKIYDVQWNGIVIGGKVTVTNNIVVGASLDGSAYNAAIYFRADSGNSDVFNNAFVHSVDSTGYVVHIHDGATGLDIQNNIFYIPSLNKGYVHILRNDDITGTIAHNCYYGSTLSIPWVTEGGIKSFADWKTLTGNSTDINIDPKFVNVTDRDFKLQPDSPCIDSGISEGTPQFDIEGNPRFDDPNTEPNTGTGIYTYYDIGVFEYIPPPSVNPPSVPFLRLLRFE